MPTMNLIAFLSAHAVCSNSAAFNYTLEIGNDNSRKAVRVRHIPITKTHCNTMIGWSSALYSQL